MMRKFLEGLVFGAGFAISLSVILLVTALWLAQSLFVPAPRDEAGVVSQSDDDRAGLAARFGYLPESGIPFHELGIEEQIKASSAIALVEFKADADGRMRAVIQEFLKKDPDTQVHYAVGDEYPPSSYYPTEGYRHGDGAVIFFTGSPASMSMSVEYSGDRLSGLGDLPLRLLREKCAKPDDQATPQ